MEVDDRKHAKPRPSKDQLSKTYSRIARIYDAWGILTESKAAGRALELALIRDGESILEVAVGTGRVFEHIVAANPTGRNEGIDLSPGMLQVAERRLSRRHSNYTLTVADAASLPCEDASFDLIVCNYMFDLLSAQDIQTVLAEFLRVLRPGGRTAITTWTRARKWYSRIWDRLIDTAPNLLLGCRPVSLESVVAQAGFVGIHSEYVSQLTFPSLVIRAEKPSAGPIAVVDLRP
jgi:ubiquinone/menaquinone biosynthesis C-methylase UbiE